MGKGCGRIEGVVLLAVLAAMPAVAPALEPIVGCEAHGAARPVCGFQNPEDLAALPGEAALLASEYSAEGDPRSGRISLLVLADDGRRVLFRGGDARGEPAPGWGDPSCPGAPTPEFSPHGLDLARHPSGALVLAVVQHGHREAIELFEVSGGGVDWRLDWRGCVPAPEGAELNDVVLLSDGSLLTTHMGVRPSPGEAFSADAGPGFVYHWTPDAGFREVPGTRGPLPNGIEVSPDESKIFLNLSFADEVRRVDRTSGEIEARAEVSAPDNSTWAPDGRLLVASIERLEAEDLSVCMQLEQGSCPIPFRIVSLDPGTLESRVLYEGGGPPLGAGTVGLRVGDELFIGTFAGDRLVRVRLEDP